MESKYLERFQKVQTNEVKARGLYRLNGSRVLIEILPKKEITSAGGIIISSPSAQVKLSADSSQALLGIVLLTGEGYVDENNNPIDLDVQPGNVVMVNEFGIKAFSTFPGLQDYTKNTLALTAENEIQMVFPNVEAYAEYEKILNG